MPRWFVTVILAAHFLLGNRFLASAQELFVSAEPASLIPVGSLNVRISGHFVSNDRIYARPSQRYIPELLLGISRHFTIGAGVTFSNMHTFQFRNESYFVYGKYRLLSIDQIHRHFRMAAFLSGSLTKAPFHYDEASLSGDKSGLELGVIATQLQNRWAFSGTLSHLQAMDKSRFNDVVYLPVRNFQFIDFSLSSGYLVLPRTYESFKQVNVNVYLEMLGQQSLDQRKHYLDLAPALQFIFFSSLRLNASYRFQMSSNMDRMTEQSWNISLEKSFLGAIRRKKEV